MRPIARLTSAGYDLACHFFPRPLLGQPPRKISRKKLGRLRRRAYLELDRLEDRTLLSASISGNVFNDLNGGGHRAAGDPGVAGQTVYLDLNSDGKFDSTQTTIAGSTSFVNGPASLGAPPAATLDVQGLPTTIQDVAVSMDVTNIGGAPIPVALFGPVGLNLSTSQGPILFFLNPGETFDGTFDDNAPTSINQTTNPVPNGTYAPEQIISNPELFVTNEDPNTTPSSQWNLVFFSDPSSVELNSWSLTFTYPEPSTQTDAAGNYSFTGLTPGTYSVGVAPTANETVTAPTAGSAVQSVSLADGQAATGTDFGVQPAADLTSVAFRLAGQPTAWGQPVTIDYTLKNEGLGDASAFAVGLYLSNNGTISSSDPLLDTLNIDGLAAGASTVGTVTIQLPATPPPGFSSLDSAYVGSIIDPTNSIAESSANQSNQGAGMDLAQLGTTPNVPVTSGSAGQQSPSIAVDPRNPQHLVTAYVDYSLLSDGYAGIGISSSTDGGATWTKDPTPIQLPAGFTQGAAAPTVAFDAQGNVYVSFMAATFLGAQPNLTDPDNTQRLDGFESNNGIFVAESNDGGTTWNTPQSVIENVYRGTSVPFESDPSLAIDTYPTLSNNQPNPNFGNLYVTWTQWYPPGQFPGDPSSPAGSFIMFASSNTSNGGTAWTTQMQTVPGSGAGTGLVSAIEDQNAGNNDGGTAGTGIMGYSTVTVGAGGVVYVSTFTGGYFTIYSSTNGGQSTNVGTNSAPFWVSGFTSPNFTTGLGTPFEYTGQVVRSSPTLDGFRTQPTREIAADPTRPGALYAVAENTINEAEHGGAVSAAGIVFAVSTDYGQSWTTNFTVGSESSPLAQLTPAELNFYLPVLNDDNGGQFPPYGSPQQDQVLAYQVMPKISVNAQGDVSVIWYDTRSDPSGMDLEVMGTVSTDGGQHFSANFPVTTTPFNPSNGAVADGSTNIYFGDQLGLVTVGDTAYAVWTDTRTGNQNIYSGSFSLAPIPAAPADRFSPNFTPQTATALGKVTVEQVVPQLALQPGSADEWFSLQAGASGDLSVSVTAVSGGNNLRLQLTDANGNALSATSTDVLDSSGNVIGQEIVVPSVAGQTFLIHVSGQTAAGLSYSLTAGALTADLGSQVQGTTAGSLSAGGVAVYRLQIDPTGSLAVTLNANSDVQGNLNLQVLAADGQTVLASIPTGGISAGKSAQLSLPVTAGEVVLIEVSGIGATDHGDFTIQFSNLDQFQTAGARTLFFPTGSTPASLAVADLTGDGNADLLVTNTTVSDSLSVLLGNGDGTFQAPEQTAVGPGLGGVNRQLAVADLTSSSIPDVIVPNSRSADVSVLLGNGNGTFQPQRRFDAVTDAEALVTGDFNGDGNTDAIVLENFAQLGIPSQFAVLLGRGDGTFEPPVYFKTAFTNGATSMVVGDFTGNGKLDLIIFSDNDPFAEIFFGNGDGTFQKNGVTFNVREDTYNAVAVDLNGDGKLDLVTTGVNSGNVYVILGNGDGTFQAPQPFLALKPPPGDNVGIHGLAVVDFGNATTPGTPDGHLDIIVTAVTRSGQGGAQVIMLPGLVDSHGNYAGFGAPVVLAHVGVAGNIVSGDFTNNGAVDLAVADTDGITVIYGKPPTLTTNSTPATARDLGTVTHLVTLSQSIVSSQEDAYYKLTVPTEAVPNSGPEVIDFAAQFQNVGGGGIQMQVLDANGNVLGTGTRFRVTAAQGAVLTVHIFGVTGTDGTPGSGSYILDVDVLPQVVSVQAESPLPGGPATSLVITLQGDRLDPAAAENPANYEVLWFGPNGPEVIPVAATAGSQPIVYNPGAYVQVASGLTYPAASRQTITLLFANPLAAGSYEIILSPAIQSAALNSSEGALLAGNTSFAGHPLVTNDNGTITNGDSVIATDLVSKGGTPNPDAIDSGTAFLTQLGNDLGALLDSLLAQEGDDPSITKALNDQILARFLPGFTPGTGPQSYVIFWLDPVAIGLQTPQQGQQVSYNLQSNSVSNTASQTYIAVGGNVEVIVVAGVAGSFNLSVADVPATARGGAVVITPNGTQEVAFTDGLRANTTSFEVTVAANLPPVSPPPVSPPPVSPPSVSPPPVSPPSVSPPPVSPPSVSPPPSIVPPIPSAESETTSVASVSPPTTNFADSLAQLVSQGLISTLVNGSAGETQATSATSFVSTGPAANGATSGVAAPSSSAGGNSGDAASKFLLEVENAIDQVFLFWRDSSDAVSNTSRPYTAGAVDVVEKAVSPVGDLWEAVGGKALIRTGLPWRDMLKILSQYSGSVTEEFSKQLPIPRLKGIQSAPPAVQPPAPEEEQESLWEQDFSESPLGEQMMWEGKEAGLALLVVSGAYHAWLRDQSEDETTSRRKPEMFSVE